MNSFDLDFDTLRDLPPLRRNDEIPQVRISASGRVSLNKALADRLDGQWDLCARTSPDYRFLVFFLDGTSNIHFSRTSRYMTHREWAMLLEKEEIALPAVYIMEWNEGRRAWVGRCQEISAPLSAAALSAGGGKKRGVRRAS